MDQCWGRRGCSNLVTLELGVADGFQVGPVFGVEVGAIDGVVEG